MTPERRLVEAQDRFLDLLTATGCEVTVDADASEACFFQYSTASPTYGADTAARSGAVTGDGSASRGSR
jgi:hypothetical protein